MCIEKTVVRNMLGGGKKHARYEREEDEED